LVEDIGRSESAQLARRCRKILQGLQNLYDAYR
jgi:hypothetical protein